MGGSRVVRLHASLVLFLVFVNLTKKRKKKKKKIVYFFFNLITLFYVGNVQ